MNALELLKQDHHMVKELFEQAESTQDEKQKRKLFDEIHAELETHASIEESIFYPAMEKYNELKDMVAESRQEHQEIKNLLAEMSADQEDLESQLEELMEIVEHHAEDEEEGEMFPKIRELVDEQELEKLGERLQSAKGQYQPQRKAG